MTARVAFLRALVAVDAVRVVEIAGEAVALLQDVSSHALAGGAQRGLERARGAEGVAV